MKTLRILFGVLSIVAAFFSFGVSCHGGSAHIDWLARLDQPFTAVSRFGQCVASFDRVFDTSDGPVAFGLMLVFLFLALLLCFSKKPQARQTMTRS